MTVFRGPQRSAGEELSQEEKEEAQEMIADALAEVLDHFLIEVQALTAAVQSLEATIKAKL